MKKRVALIYGVSGQDGSYLAELLLKKKYKVFGVIRRQSGDYNFNLSSIKLKNIVLTDRQLSDLELILNNGFNPVKEFMNKKDYN